MQNYLSGTIRIYYRYVNASLVTGNSELRGWIECVIRVVRRGEENIMGLLGILWVIVAILLAVWIAGMVVHFAGGFIYILLVVAIAVAIFSLLRHARASRL